jgi:hypothetical protein
MSSGSRANRSRAGTCCVWSPSHAGSLWASAPSGTSMVRWRVAKKAPDRKAALLAFAHSMKPSRLTIKMARPEATSSQRRTAAVRDTP